MQRKLINLPDDICERFDSVVAPGSRSRIMSLLLIQETKKREEFVRRCVNDVESKLSLCESIERCDKSTGDVIDDVW